MSETRSPSPNEESEKDAQSVEQKPSTSSEAEKVGAELKNLSLKREKIEDKLGPMTSKSGKVEESIDPKKDRKLEREIVEGIDEDDVEFGKEENSKEENTEEGFDPNVPSSSTAQPQDNNISNLLNNQEIQNTSTLSRESAPVDIPGDAGTPKKKGFWKNFWKLCGCWKKTGEIARTLSRASRSSSIHPQTVESEV